MGIFTTFLVVSGICLQVWAFPANHLTGGETAVHMEGRSDRKDQTRTVQIALQYATNETLSGFTVFLRQMYASLLETELQSVDLNVVSKVALDDSQDDLPKIYAVDIFFNLSKSSTGFASKLKTSGATFLPSVSQPFEISLDQKVTKMATATSTILTVFDVIKAPRTEQFTETGKRSYIVYDTILSDIFNNTKEREDFFHQIRQQWTNAASAADSENLVVDLAVTQDIVNFDGSHQFTYVVNFLYDELLDLEKVIDNFITSLAAANVPKMVARLPSDPKPHTDQQPDHSGIRSYGFYDKIVLEYNMKSEQDYESAMEDIRKNWAKVLGQGSWNVKIVPKRKSSGVQEQLIISYLIMFTTTEKQPTTFNEYRSQFAKLIPNIRGPTYSASAYNNEPTIENIILTATPPTAVKQVRQTPVMLKSDSVPHAPIKPKGPRTVKPVATTTVTSNEIDGQDDHSDSLKSADKESKTKAWSRNSISSHGGKGAKQNPHGAVPSGQTTVQEDVSQMEPTYQSFYLNVYLISDQFRLSVRNSDELNTFMDKIDVTWHETIGNKTEFAQIVLFEDAVAPNDKKVHDIRYVVIILSSDAHLDLQKLKTDFERKRPVPPGKKHNLGELGAFPYNFLVIKDTYPLLYSDISEMNKFVSNLQQLWIEALGDQVTAVEVIMYEDNVNHEILDFARGNEQEQRHQLSYIVFIASTNLLDELSVQKAFHQYLINLSINSVTRREPCLSDYARSGQD